MRKTYGFENDKLKDNHVIMRFLEKEHRAHCLATINEYTVVEKVLYIGFYSVYFRLFDTESVNKSRNQVSFYIVFENLNYYLIEKRRMSRIKPFLLQVHIFKIFVPHLMSFFIVFGAV